jgi:hypothetical protein
MSRKGAKEKNLSGFAPLREKFLFPIFSIYGFTTGFPIFSRKGAESSGYISL